MKELIGAYDKFGICRTELAAGEEGVFARLVIRRIFKSGFTGEVDLIADPEIVERRRIIAAFVSVLTREAEQSRKVCFNRADVLTSSAEVAGVDCFRSRV